MTDAIFVYVTCSSREEAEQIASHVVEKELSACANIFPSHQAVYRWQGKVERAEEIAMIFKTRDVLFDRLRAEICSLHSYDCPCIVALPITDGHAPFLQWIGEQTLAG